MREPVSSCGRCSETFVCKREESLYFIDSVTGSERVTPLPDDPTKGRCVPVPEKRFVCNPYSGRTLLATRAGRAFWYCDPKYPNLVDKLDYFGDVEDDTPACSERGTLVHPETHVPWRKTQDFEPIHGVCDCPDDRVAQGFDCIRNPCYPGVVNENGRGCYCPSSHVECGVGTAVFEDWELQYHCPDATESRFGKKCVRDPCSPHGFFDRNKKKCVSESHQVIFGKDIPRRGYVISGKKKRFHIKTPYNCPSRK